LVNTDGKSLIMKSIQGNKTFLHVYLGNS